MTDLETLERIVNDNARDAEARLALLESARKGGWTRVTIIVPILPDGSLVDYRATQDCHAYVKTTLADKFGGYSAVEGSGGYIMDDGSLATDRWVRYEVVVKGYGLAEAYDLNAIARRVGIKLNQESVLMVVEHLNGSVHFVRPNDTINTD